MAPNPIFRGGGPHDEIARATRRSHPGAEPSDPPPRSERESEPSFQGALAHFAAAAERMTKRVTALLAVASSAGVMGSTALAYWTAHQGYVKQDTIAEINASVRRIEHAVESHGLTVQAIQEHDRLQDQALFEHTQQLAELTPPTPKKRR